MRVIMDSRGIKNTIIVSTVFLILSFCNGLIAEDYRILVTNDDGVASPLLHILVGELSLIAGVEVVVVAPETNQSGSSQSSIGGPLVVKKVDLEGSVESYSVSGRPADAVRFAVVQLSKDRDFDLVISGINRGANVGNVSHLSGTVGAAMESLYHGIPAIAVSQEVSGVNTEDSARFVSQFVTRYQETTPPHGVVIAINIPAGELQGVALRAMGDSYLKTASYDMTQVDGGEPSFEPRRIRVDSANPVSDTYAYQKGYITVTPLKFDWTSYSVLNEMNKWNLELP
jgi:5'-nucleotidase